MIPAWLMVVLIGIGELLAGVILFLVLHKFILTKSVEPLNTYQRAPLEDISHN